MATGQIVTRDQFRILPMPASAIARMNFLSTADGRIATITDSLDYPPDARQDYADEPAPPVTSIPMATHGSPEIESSPDVESPLKVESDEQRGAHDRNEDSMTQDNAPEEHKIDDGVENGR